MMLCSGSQFFQLSPHAASIALAQDTLLEATYLAAGRSAYGKTKLTRSIKRFSLGRGWVSVRRRFASHVAQSAGKKSMSAIVRLHLILRIYVGPPPSPADIFFRSRRYPDHSSAYTECKSDAVLQAESAIFGITGATWTGC